MRLEIIRKLLFVVQNLELQIWKVASSQIKTKSKPHFVGKSSCISDHNLSASFSNLAFWHLIMMIFVFSRKFQVCQNWKIRSTNNGAESEIGFLTKSISKPYGRGTAMPPAWEFRKFIKILLVKFIQKFSLILKLKVVDNHSKSKIECFFYK